MNSLTVPDEFNDWPFDAKRFVLAEANSTVELREAINGYVGLPNDFEATHAGKFTKAELAAVLMALGGPDGGSP